MRTAIWIILGSIGLACLLGLALDVVTANVAVEYFTVYHPYVVDSQSPWVMAGIWGIIASWWFGAIVGLILAWINHWRAVPLRPRRVLAHVFRACAWLWAIMIGLLIVTYFGMGMIAGGHRGPHFEANRRLWAVSIAHGSEYILGAIALVLVGRKIKRESA